MKPRMWRIPLAVVALSFCVGTGAFAAGGVSSDAGGDEIKGSVLSPERPVVRPFKLKGGGQIDVTTFSFDFAGTATHLGRFVASGQLDPQTFQVQGTMTAADGDELNWVAAFVPTPLGAFDATLTIVGGTGRFINASGTAQGLVLIDPDFMFSISLEGVIAY